jgi:energy-converting hydrogenase Eha subunit F
LSSKQKPIVKVKDYDPCAACVRRGRSLRTEGDLKKRYSFFLKKDKKITSDIKKKAKNFEYHLR